MLDQNTFIETVQSVAEIIRTSAEPIGRDEIMSYFKDMELNKAQEDMVFEFLITPHEQENESAGDYEDESQDELHGDESSENAALNNVIYSEGDSMDAIAGGKNNKAKQDNEAEPDIDEDSLIPDSPMFRMYLEELEEIPDYTKAEQDDMYKKLLAGDESVIHTISNFWLKSVLAMAKKLAVTSEGFEDVVQEGNMGLFMCLTELCGCGDEIDVEKELLDAIEESMKECIREQTGEDESENTVVGKVSLVNRAVEKLKSDKGFEPSLSELSGYTGVDEEELEKLLELIKKADVEKRVAELLEQCGLEKEYAKRYPHEVSGGQCQRAAIARALAVEPKVLICDEATSALDVTIQKQIMELLEDLKEKKGLSFIFICHNLALVQMFCDRVLVLYEGKVVESGIPDDIINEPKEEYTQRLVDAVLS